MVLEHKLEHLATRGVLTLIAVALVAAAGWVLWHDPEAAPADPQNPPAVEEPGADG